MSSPFKKLFGGSKKENNDSLPEKKVIKVPAEEPKKVPAVPKEIVPAIPETDEGELITAITAAIAVFMENSDKPLTSFRVVSFRRTASKQ